MKECLRGFSVDKTASLIPRRRNLTDATCLRNRYWECVVWPHCTNTEMPTVRATDTYVRTRKCENWSCVVSVDGCHRRLNLTVIKNNVIQRASLKTVSLLLKPSLSATVSGGGAEEIILAKQWPYLASIADQFQKDRCWKAPGLSVASSQSGRFSRLISLAKTRHVSDRHHRSGALSQLPDLSNSRL